MLIKNAENTSDDKASEGNINRWREFTSLDGKECSVKDCPHKSDPIFGAHVEKMWGKENKEKEFIIPMCRTHNNQFGETLDIYDNTRFMPASEL